MAGNTELLVERLRALADGFESGQLLVVRAEAELKPAFEPRYFESGLLGALRPQEITTRVNLGMQLEYIVKHSQGPVKKDLVSPPERQSGCTSRAMRECPRESFFVWVNEDLYYPISLALYLGREDLRIVGPSFFDAEYRKFWRTSTVVLDHACVLRADRRRNHAYMMARLGEAR